MAGPSAEEFNALVADLRAEIATLNVTQAEAVRGYVQRPACFARYPWVSVSILLGDASRLTGYSQETMNSYARRKDPAARRARFPVTLTPERKTSFRYAAGDIAVWFAFRDPSRSAKFGQRRRYRPPPRAGGEASKAHGAWREQAIAVIARAVEANPALRYAEAMAACERAGTGVPGNGAVLLDEARAMALPVILARFASPRPDGLVSLPEVAAVFGVTYQRVLHAVTVTGTITAVKDGRLLWADPSRLRYRTEKSRTRARRHDGTQLPPVPVDRDDPRAVPLPGEEAGRAV